MNRRKQGDVSWYLPNSKRPFAYSTIAEADTVAILLEEFGDLRAVVSANRILSHCLLYTSPSPRDSTSTRLPSYA